MHYRVPACLESDTEDIRHKPRDQENSLEIVKKTFSVTFNSFSNFSDLKKERAQSENCSLFFYLLQIKSVFYVLGLYSTVNL